MADPDIRAHITELIGTEKDLRDKLARGEIDAAEEHERLRGVEIELDQCWDLLRQRQALREFGEEADQASVRPEGIVENYRQ